MAELADIPTPATGPEPRTKPPPVGLFRGWLSGWRSFLVTALLLLLMRSVAIDWNVVPTGSMKPTIVEGDYIFVNKLAYDLKVPFTGRHLVEWGGPSRGDIVVFTPPGETERYVKRIVGVPGDVIEIRDNQLFINRAPARYQPLDPKVLPDEERDGHTFGQETVAGRTHAVMFTPETPSLDNLGPTVVPPGHYFMLGDNRDNSRDSRYFGFVARERIVGRAWSVAVSLEPGHGPRWYRFFSALS